MSGTTRRVFGVAGLILLVAFLWWGSQYFIHGTPNTISTDLAPFKTVGEAVKSDFTEHPLLTISEDYAITDTLKDGVEITYGGVPTDSDRGESSGSSRGLSSGDLPNDSAVASTTSDSLTLQFPKTLQEPLTITLPNNRSFTVTHEVEGAYTRELLTGDLPTPRTDLGNEDRGESSGFARGLSSVEVDEEQFSPAPTPTYLKYTSPDSRQTTYYAYQKDQAAGYRNLKHWTIFASGTGEESQSYLFHNAHLRTNDRGEVEVRYIAPLDESKKAAVGDDVWARAQAVLQADLEASIEDTPPDLLIPPPYTIDANGTKVIHEWSVTTQKEFDPTDTSGGYRLTVSFEVPMLGYPIALDPTLQFTAPGVSNAGAVITGEGASNLFGIAMTTGDFNNDGKDDLVVSAPYYDGYTGRVYIFYQDGDMTTNAASADVIITDVGGANDLFGHSFATGDFNSDGRIDLAVGMYEWASYGGLVYIFYNDGSYPATTAEADVTLTSPGGTAFGSALTSGDFNADGRTDIAIGAHEAGSGMGAAYIFYNDGSMPTTVATADVTITGEDDLGTTLTTGDWNADGKDDLAVGATGYNSDQGRTYIFYNDGSIPTTADVIITGESTWSYFSSSLTTGDFNADGKDDLAVGAYEFNYVYLFYGGSMTSEYASGADITLTGNDAFGYSLATGDWNTDGKDDLAVGGYRNDTYRGRTYLFYGGSMTSENASGADVTLTGEATNNFFSYSLTTGDFNSDGKDDLAVGASGYNSSQGRTYIFYSQSGQVNLNTHITGEGTSDYFGSAFTTGDWNADGKEDLAVGAFLDNTNTGKVYIFYNDGSYPTGAASADVILTGETTANRFGHSLASGDFNADGKVDLAVGAWGYNSIQGRTYIFYSGSMISENASGADVTLTGEASNNAFSTSLTTGDWNADGKDDLAIAGEGYNSSQGRTYLFYGGSMTSEFASTSDVILTGESASNNFGFPLTTGDFNADGKDDLTVGAYGYNSSQGRTYIFYGGSMISENGSGADVTLTGEATNNQFGLSLTTGDLNADGKDDLAVGASGYNSSQGRAYLFYGGSMSSENATSSDVTLTGEATNNFFGISLTTGDFNHDGKDDLAVGAKGYTTNTGRAYIFYNDGSYPSSAGSADVIITGNSTNDDFGYALATFDYNADGRDDLVVGAPGYNAGGDTGRLYFYETRENYAWDIQRQSLNDGIRVDPLMGYEMKITGETTGNSFGTSIATGDYNADGKDDLAVGAQGYNSYQGRVYIFYNDGSYGTKAGRADVMLTGEATNNYFGTSIATGDFNADGKDDLAVGAFGYNSSQGRTYIFYGGAMASEGAATADVILTGEATGNSFGTSIATGDFNADGKDDLTVGAQGYNSSKGRTYLFYGGSMTTENASGADVILTGAASGDFFGISLITGDYNADGKDDLAVGAFGYNVYTFQGRAYLFYGGSMVSENATSSDVTLTGEATNNYFGASLTTGDFNADGKDDLTVGAQGYNSSKGRTYIFYGGAMASEGAATADVILTGEATNNSFGTSIATGDFNTDGKDDLAVGATGYNSAQGRTYIFYGGSMVSENATSSDVTLTGEATSNSFGSPLTTGDFNADGKDDIAVGAYGYNSNQGRLYFYTTNDYQLTGTATGDKLGSALAVGDFNQDGKNDLAVGAYGYNSAQGRVYIFYGGALKTETTAGADVILTGGASGNFFGLSLTSGDFNADGKDDLAVSAIGYSQGRTYLFYGGSMITENATGADITLTGEAVSNDFGSSLTTGDFNADGLTDIAVNAESYSFSKGRVYIFYGGSIITENASDADVILTGEANSNSLGDSLTTGDINVDGKDDLVVGAPGYNSFQGRIYIFYGGSLITESASGADIILTGEAVSNDFGTSLTTGDFNADGKDDLVVGAQRYNSFQGRTYLFYGGSMISKNASGADVTLTGEATGNYFGYSLTTGDYNADGKDDLAVGANEYNTSQGRVYLFYGKNLRTVSAAYADVIVTGQATNSNFGSSLLAADLSGNGVDDLIIGASSYDVSGTNGEGRVYIISSEAATEHLSSHRFQGTIQFFGTGTFH